MCVIIHKPAGKTFTPEDLASAKKTNADGFGYMYYHPAKKEIIARKSINYSVEEIQTIVKRLENFDTCLHYRLKTHGKVAQAQCHPFKILNKKDHGVDMYFMHNGVIRDELTLRKSEKISDTQAFCKNILLPLLKDKPSLIKTTAVQKLLGQYVVGSKLIFMYGEGKVVIINEDKGDTHNECWVSNTRSWSTYNRGNAYGNNGYQSGRGGHNSPLNRHNANLKEIADAKKKTTTPPKTTTNTSTTRGTDDGEKSTITNVLCDLKFNGAPTKVGDAIHIWHVTNASIHGSGKVVEISAQSCEVRWSLIDPNGKNAPTCYRDRFWCNDGSCVQNARPYHALNVAGIEDDTNVGKSVKEVKTEGNVHRLPVSKGGNNPEKKSEKVEKPVSAFPTIGYKDVIVDPEDRYKLALDFSRPSDYDGYSFETVAAMTEEDRLKFFVDEPNASFNMFQDLVEHAVELGEEIIDTIDFFEDEDIYGGNDYYDTYYNGEES